MGRRAHRRDDADEILAAADARDVDADARDAAAVERENAFDKEDFLADEGTYGHYWPERRAAGRDRAHSKDDRTASHDDRIALTEDQDEDEDEDEGVTDP